MKNQRGGNSFDENEQHQRFDAAPMDDYVMADEHQVPVWGNEEGAGWFNGDAQNENTKEYDDISQLTWEGQTVEDALPEVLRSSDDSTKDFIDDNSSRSRSTINVSPPRKRSTKEEKNEFLETARTTVVNGVNNFFSFLDETQVQWSSWSSGIKCATVAWMKVHKRGSFLKLIKATMVVSLAAIAMPYSGDNKAMVRDTSRLMGQGVQILSVDGKPELDGSIGRSKSPLSATLHVIRTIEALDEVLRRLAEEVRTVVGEAVMTSLYTT